MSRGTSRRRATRSWIDAHVHLTTWWPDIRRTGYRADLDFSLPGLLREMDESGISRALALQMFFAPSEEDALVEGRHLYEESQGRLLPVATIDPTRGEEAVAATLARLEKEQFLVGIKLYPGYRPFYPHDRRLEPVYEFAHRRRLPVLLHQGDTLEGLGLLKFARPVEVDEVAGRFRDVRFVLCHLGNPWIDEAVGVLYKNPNVYTDTSGLLSPPSAPHANRAAALASRWVEDAVVGSGAPERFLFGSDWPLASPANALGVVDRLSLDEPERAGILGGNARELFNLHPD